MSREIQPIFIMPEGTQRNTGRTAQRNNIMAAKLIAETVRTTLGPKGMDKMIVDSLGDIIVTNDGATIVRELQIEHPAAKMIVEVAKTQDDEIGDGTTTAVVLAGELLSNAEALLEKNIHPTVIAKGYRMAAAKSQEILESISQKMSIKDSDILTKLALTAMTGKGAEIAKERLADLAVLAVKQVVDEEGHVNRGDVKLEKKVGGGVEDSELVKGIILDKEKIHPGMPSVVKSAKIALVDCAIEIKGTETEAKIQITDPAQMQAFLEQEERMLKEMVDKIVDSGANVLICQKGIDDLAQHFLAKQGIFAVRRVKKSDMDSLARATGAEIVTNLDDLNHESIGFAGTVAEVKVGDEMMTYVKECKNPKSVTLLVRGGTEHVVEEIKRAVEDAVGDIAAALKVGKVLAGAGASEMEVSRGLKKYANSLSGREQLAVQAFAEAVEIIPRTLAENAGLDPVDIIAELKSAHDKGKTTAGIDVFTGKVVDAWRAGVLEPLNIKTQALKSSSEVANMILRIDDVILGKGTNQQMPPGMGGMPPGGMPEM
jgi:thermosome